MDCRAFVNLYNAIVDSNKQRNWENVYTKIMDIDLTDELTVKRYMKQTEVILKIVNYVLKQTLPAKCEPSHINHFTKSVLQFFQVAIAQHPIDIFVKILNNLNVLEVCPNYLPNVLKILAGRKKNQFSSFTDAHMEFTKSIIVFMRNEKAQKTGFANTLALIKMYSGMEAYRKCDDHNGSYQQCLSLIEVAVKMCSCAANRDKLANNLLVQLRQLKTNQTIELSAKEDTAITISQVITNGHNYLNAALNDAFLMLFYRIVRELYGYIRKTRLSKSFHSCTDCDDLKRHTIIDMGFYVYYIYIEALKQNVSSDGSFTLFVDIYQQYLIALQSFKCQIYLNQYVQQANATLKSIVGALQSIRPACGVKLLNWFLDNRPKLPTMSIAIDDMYILSTLTAMLWSGGVDKFGDEFVRIATLYLSHLLDPSSANVSNRNEIDAVMYRICDYQAKMGNDESFQSIATIYTANKSTYKIKPPPSNDTATNLLICQLKIATNFGQLSARVKKAILTEILASNVDNTVNKLAAIFVCDMATVNSQPNIQRILQKCVRQFDQLNSADQLRLILVGATFSAYKYFQEYTEWEAEHRTTALNVDTLSNSLFLKLNMEFEMKLIKMLDRAARDYEKFVRVIVTNFRDNVVEFETEIGHAIEMLRKVADQYALRNYVQKAMHAYQLLYAISVVSNNEFGQINAVGFFAENSKLFIAKQIDCVQQSLETIIGQMDERLLNILRTLSTYSARKRKQILYALLSISIYYLQSQSTMIRAKTILTYVDGTINKDGNNFDSIPCKYYYAMFMLLKMNRTWVGFSASEFAQHMNGCIRSMRVINTEDAISLPTVLFDFIVVSANYALNCGDYENLEVTLKMILKWAQRIGTAYRCGQLMMLLVEMHARSEKVRPCESLCTILDAMYGLHDCSSPAEVNFKTNLLTVPDATSTPISIRKSVRCLSPLTMIKNGHENIVARYITRHLTNCTCVLCANKQFVIVKLHLATNAIRLLTLKCDYQSALLNFEYLYEYYTKTMPKSADTSDPLRVDDYHSAAFRMLFHYTMSLLRNNDLGKAKAIFSMTKDALNKMDFIDCAQQQQIMSTDHMICFQLSKIETIEIKEEPMDKDLWAEIIEESPKKDVVKSHRSRGRTVRNKK